MGYSNRTWVCPFFTFDKKLEIHCEAGVLKFQDRAAIHRFSCAYCANKEHWRDCTLAGALWAQYERDTGAQ